MKRFLMLPLLIILAIPGLVWADATVTSATNARTASLDKGINGVTGVADISSGKSLEIDSRGAASVLEYPKTIAVNGGKDLGNGVQLVTGACRVSTVICSGNSTAAGDAVLLYDNTAASGIAKIECTVGTAKDTNVITIPGGATFSTGIFADGTGNVSHISVMYDE